MEIKITNQNNYKYTTLKFKGKADGANLLSLLTKSFENIKSKCTQGHFDNIYFKTNLNDVLRNPDAKIIDELQYMAMSYMPNSIKTGIGQYYRKIPIKENPITMKQQLNDEFTLLPKMAKKQKYYRGIENISDSEYQKFLSYRKGEIVSPDKGYAYITNSIEEANIYNRGRNGILFEIELPIGSQISELQAIMPPKTSGFMFGEIKNEAVVPAGALYEVKENPSIDKDGILHIYLKFLNKWE